MKVSTFFDKTKNPNLAPMRLRAKGKGFRILIPIHYSQKSRPTLENPWVIYPVIYYLLPIINGQLSPSGHDYNLL